jgi:hypothetical protein
VVRKSQSVRLDELLAAFCDNSRRNIFVILRGYFDESYRLNSDPKVFTLSCPMSSPTGWLEIERGWKLCLNAKNRELKTYGRKELSRYHAADCSSLTNEFKGWSVPEQIEFCKQLFATLNRGRAWVNVISYSLPINDFIQELSIEGDPLRYCYREMVKFVMLEIAAQHRDAQKKHGSLKEISFVLFHERCGYDEEYLGAFNKMLADETFAGRYLFRTIAPLGWEDCIPLQPADMMAYEAFKEAERKFTGRKRRKSLEILLDSKGIGGRAKQFDVENLKEWRDILERSVKGV